MEPPHSPTEKSAAYCPQTNRKVPFSGAVDHLNKAATARYFGHVCARFPMISTGAFEDERIRGFIVREWD
jgi:hypothetical protein